MSGLPSRKWRRWGGRSGTDVGQDGQHRHLGVEHAKEDHAVELLRHGVQYRRRRPRGDGLRLAHWLPGLRAHPPHCQLSNLLVPACMPGVISDPAACMHWLSCSSKSVHGATVVAAKEVADQRDPVTKGGFCGQAQ